MPEFRLPEVFPLLPLDLFPAGGGEEPLVARSVYASSLLSPRFIRALGILELLSFSELQLFYVRLALSPHLSFCNIKMLTDGPLHKIGYFYHLYLECSFRVCLGSCFRNKFLYPRKVR